MSGQIPPGSDPLVHRLSALLLRPVGAADRARAALALLDWAGCAVIGGTTPVARKLRQATGAAGRGSCTVVGGPPLPAEVAARCNGALGNTHEMDDVDKRARLHPGPCVIPAALAAAELSGASGAALLDGLVRGYEAAVRLGRALGDPHYAVWHSTATCGTLGAAAAAASVLGLDRDGMAQALALAATRTGGLWETRNDPRSDAKQLHTAQAAGDGLTAALCAQAGLRGPARVLEGGEGLFAATARGSDPESVLAAAGGWLVHDISVKPWPACRHAHPVIDACLLLREGLDVAAVQAVEVGAYADALRFCDRPEPASVIEAKFSLQHSAAVALLLGPPPLSAFDPPAIADPAVAALRAKVGVAVDAGVNARYPRHFGAVVTLRLADGTLRRVEVPDALGDPENPLPQDRVEAKARMLCAAAGMGDAAIDRLVRAALGVETGGVAAFTAALPGEGA